MPYHLIDHTADLGIEITATTLPSLFTEAAAALTRIILDAEPPDFPFTSTQYNITGHDLVDLMVRFLSEILYLIMEQCQATTSVDITAINDKSLTATLCLVPVDFTKNPPAIEIKAVTYHQAVVQETPEGWLARVIVDI